MKSLALSRQGSTGRKFLLKNQFNIFSYYYLTCTDCLIQFPNCNVKNNYNFLQHKQHGMLQTLWYDFNFRRWSSTILHIIHNTSLLLKFMANKQTNIQFHIISDRTIFLNSMLYVQHIILFAQQQQNILELCSLQFVCMEMYVCSSVDILLLHLLAII